MSHQPLSRRRFLKLTGGAIAAAATAPAAGVALAAKRRCPPNVVFILADDLGWRDTSPYGSRFYETPNMKRLAKRGVMFTQAYAANPLCSPTRASIMTGLWPARIGITAPVCHLPEVKLEETVIPKARPDQEFLVCDSATRLKQQYYTLAEAIKDAGYTTGHFGKWHLGSGPYDPLHQGFDVDVPHTPGPGPAGSYVGPWEFPASLNFTGEPGEHIEDRMANEAAKFMRANKDRPFFLNYWCFSVHSPWDAKKELIEKYAARVDPKNPQRNPLYCAMVRSMDDAVGLLLDTLDDLKLADNTLIVFFSDNGGVHWPGAEAYPDTPITSNSPLRGGKATIYEGGTREPCIIVWPDHARPGSKCGQVVQSIDFYPTILEVAGLKPKNGQEFDGISIVPALKGRRLSREAIFCYFPHVTGVPDSFAPAVYVRKGDWKLIRFFHDGPNFTHRHELYNLKDDLGETTNLANQKPEKVKELDALIERFLEDTRAVLPKPNPDYDPAAKLLKGWWAVRNLKMTVKDGVVVGEATGGLATIATFKVPVVTGEVTLEFRMRSTASGPVNAFWSLPREGSFKADRAVPVAFEHDGQWHDCSVRLPCTGRLGGLRLDPANGKGGIEIDWIRLKDAQGEVKKEWTFEEEPEGEHR